MFTRYKSPALVNLDWTTTFTPELLRKDLDLGLELGREMDVPMPVTAATREVLQGHFGHATLQPDPHAYLKQGFRGADGDHGARRRHEAGAGEQKRSDWT
jgi:3-hydroxyisobutyrate dehydrogenase